MHPRIHAPLPTRPLADLSGTLEDGRRWAIVRGRLTVGRDLVGENLRTVQDAWHIEEGVHLLGELAAPCPPSTVQVGTVGALVARLATLHADPLYRRGAA